jgi:hypothetical protein
MKSDLNFLKMLRTVRYSPDPNAGAVRKILRHRNNNTAFLNFHENAIFHENLNFACENKNLLLNLSHHRRFKLIHKGKYSFFIIHIFRRKCTGTLKK